MRKSWTDDRLDDFAGEVWRRFDEVDRRLDRVDGRLERIDVRLERFEERFEALHMTIHRMMFRGAFAICGTLGVGFVGVIVAVAAR